MNELVAALAGVGVFVVARPIVDAIARWCVAIWERGGERVNRP